MAKRKRGIAAYRRKKKSTNIISAKANPPPLKDVMDFVVPSFAGYAGTRMVSRIVHGMIIKRYPRLAKHASVISTGIAAGAAWLLVHRIQSVKQYHTPVVVGAGIAAIQTAVQAYLPKYGWMVSDHNLNAQNAAQAALPPIAAQQYPKTRQNTVVSAAIGSPGDLPPPIATLSSNEIADELDDLDMGSLGDLDVGGGISDMEMDMMIDDVDGLPN